MVRTFVLNSKSSLCRLDFYLRESPKTGEGNIVGCCGIGASSPGQAYSFITGEPEDASDRDRENL
jgi:hypothetical protein